MHRNWFNALKTLAIIFFILVINTKYLALADEVPNEMNEDDLENYQMQELEEARIAKRAWSHLQGSWGKRNDDAMREDQVQTQIENHQNIDQPDMLRNFDYEPTRFIDYNMISDSDDFEGSQPVEKRAWNSMNGAWGKRNWKVRSTGKREPGSWNNLRGLWGKRSSSPKNWNHLSSAWGRK